MTWVQLTLQRHSSSKKSIVLCNTYIYEGDIIDNSIIVMAVSGDDSFHIIVVSVQYQAPVRRATFNIPGI